MKRIQKSTILTIGLCILVLLSGCSFFQSGPEQTPTDTTPETPSPEEASRDSYPPGFSQTNLNASEAVENHKQALKKTGAFRLIQRNKNTKNGTTRSASSEWSINLETKKATGEINGLRGNQKVYHNGGKAYVQLNPRRTENKTYRKFPKKWNTSQQIRSRLTENILSNIKVKYTGEKQKDGANYLYYKILDTTSQRPQNATVHILDVSGYVHVSEESGYISEISLTTEYSNNRTTHNEFIIEPDSSITVEEPAWLSNVP